jgi:hypothetical protein
MKWTNLVENLIFSPVFEWLKQDGDHSKTGQKFVQKLNGSSIQMSGFWDVNFI